MRETGLMPSAGSPGRLEPDGGSVVVASASVLGIATIAYTAAGTLDDFRTAVAFGALIAVGELIRFRLPGNRVQAPLGLAGALGYGLVGQGDLNPTPYPFAQVCAVVTCGMLLGALPHVAAGRRPELEGMARRLLFVAVVTGLYDAVTSLTGPGHILPGPDQMSSALLMVLAVLAGSVVDVALRAGVLTGRHHAPFSATFRNELRAVAGIGAAIGVTGLLLAVATNVVGLGAIPIFSVPLLLAQLAFRRYAGARQTYVETIRALSRATEVGGYTEPGHARRVAELATAVGRDLGLTEERLRLLEYAALLHDIGQVSLTDPIPGGATVLSSPEQQHRIAGLGADVIRQTGVLDQVARIVELQAEPYRRPHEHLDHTVPLESRIIRAANAFDDLVGDLPETGRRLEALERLRLGMAYEYDPRVVESLVRIIDRSVPVVA